MSCGADGTQTTESVATLNAATQSAGDVVKFCGAITTPPQVTGSGSSGNVITYYWETGARISVTFGQIFNLNGSKAFLLFDGGVACGPATSCDTVEAAHLTTYASGQAGIIEATANGGALPNQDNQTQAFYGCNGCHDIEIRNIIIRNLYIHSGLTDMVGSTDTGIFAFQCSISNSGCASGTISIHDSTIHDLGNTISLQETSAVTFNVYNIDFYRMNWAMENSGNGTRTFNFHDNHCHDTANWDTNGDWFHHNCLHNYTNVSSDSTALNFYNNLSDGDWGNCCTTETMMFTEDDSPNNFNVYNNVCLQYTGNTAPCIDYTATTGIFVNNTAIGVTTSGNVYAFHIGGTNLSLENNAVTGYGQYLYVNAGATFTVFDYNQWGTTEGSGNSPWQWMSTGANSFSAWQAACSCDAHGGQSASLGVNTTGVPQSGSVLIGAGVNLTSLGITALDSGTSAGSTVAPVARGASGSWDVGAYTYSGSTTPTVTTTTATSITTTTASAGGTVTSNGGASISSEGTCYSTSANPTTPCTSDGTSTPFTSSLTGLSASTTYHYRAFATNTNGTSYGSDMTFTTSAAVSGSSGSGFTASGVRIQ